MRDRYFRLCSVQMHMCLYNVNIDDELHTIIPHAFSYHVDHHKYVWKNEQKSSKTAPGYRLISVHK